MTEKKWTKEDLPFTVSGDFHIDVVAETQRARLLFPANKHMLAALVEEVGELSQAMIDQDFGKKSALDVYKEAVQVGAMAARVAIDGDPSFPYRNADIDAELEKERG